MRMIGPALAFLVSATPLWADPVFSGFFAGHGLFSEAEAGSDSGTDRHREKRIIALSDFLLGERLKYGMRDKSTQTRAKTKIKTAEDANDAAFGFSSFESDAGFGYQLVGRAASGWDIVFGGRQGDLAEEAAEQASPDALEKSRPRRKLRAGLKTRRDNVSAFYGLGWQGDEFEGEPDDNLVGAMQLQLRF